MNRSDLGTSAPELPRSYAGCCQTVATSHASARLTKYSRSTIFGLTVNSRQSSIVYFPCVVDGNNDAASASGKCIDVNITTSAHCWRCVIILFLFRLPSRLLLSFSGPNIPSWRCRRLHFADVVIINPFKTAEQRTIIQQYGNWYTLPVDGWVVTFGTAWRGLGGLGPRSVPSSLYQM